MTAVFRAGQLVACANDTFDFNDHVPGKPIKGNVYTISVVAFRPELTLVSPVSGIFLTFEEVPPASGCTCGKCGWLWQAENFRPVVTPSIEVFTEILTKTDVPLGDEPSHVNAVPMQ